MQVGERTQDRQPVSRCQAVDNDAAASAAARPRSTIVSTPKDQARPKKAGQRVPQTESNTTYDKARAAVYHVYAHIAKSRLTHSCIGSVLFPLL